MSNSPELYTLPISARPPRTWTQSIKCLLFLILFDCACIMINAFQFVVLLPIRLLPFRRARRLYYEGIRYTKGSFGCLLILMCQWFSPTKLRITFETQGPGRFGEDDLERIVVKNADGEVVALNLPTKFVLIANHQVYADWWYAWCLSYFIGANGVHRHVFITLKKSLQWVPIVGWGMQFFNFIFLARSWASDRVHLASRLASLGKETKKEDRPFCFMLYPEGTLVSKDTRPVSKKYADKMGIEDMRNILLPRSTGLHYSLRSLSPRIPDLKLLDLTVVYPGNHLAVTPVMEEMGILTRLGIPPMGYGQSYYTLRSIFFDGVAPPAIHMHLRLFDVRNDVPIGDVSTGEMNGTADTSDKHAVEVDCPVPEKERFDVWLRDLWKIKDELISQYYETGSLGKGSAPVDVPLKLRHRREILDAFCFFIPAGVYYLLGKGRQS